MTKRLFIIWFAVLIILALPACTPAQGFHNGQTTPGLLNAQETTDFKTAGSMETDVDGSLSEFSLDLFQRVAAVEAGKNVFVSPLSVWLALGMAYNGASGSTAEGMAEALHAMGIPLDELNAANAGLSGVLASADSKAKVDIANSIWMCEEFGKQVEKAFLDTNTSFYGAQVRALDFGDPKAADVINEWVKESTKGTIDGIVQPPICDDIVMYLINAVYFNAPWKKAFDPKRTHTGEFALSGGGTVQADFMSVPSGEPKTGYVDGDVCVVRLPYASGRLEMAAVMPKDRSLGDFIAGLNESVLQAYLDKCSETDVLLRFPKFKVEFEIKLNDALKAMGMDKAFSTEADFSGMSKSYGKQLYISEVKHRSCIDVDEQGTEAAAVTSVAIAGCAPVEPMNLKFDKPFLYLIRDTKTGAILFVGAMENPS